ncbi:MAG: hypothetical protein WCH75_27655 [Candidatus Binatia bacterium]
MKIISFGAVLVALFLGLATFGPSEAEDYYIYNDPDGKLTISNKKPPPWKQNHPAARPAGVPNVSTEETAAERTWTGDPSKPIKAK